MKQYFNLASKVIFALGMFVIFVLVSQSFGLNWGKLELAPTATVTVTGQADGDQLNQLATFRATVSVDDEDKQLALTTANETMTELIAALKEFGITDQDLQTEQVSVYQFDEPETEILMYPPRKTTGTELWQASNSITVTLREIDQASALATLLTESGATNVSGPNFTVDDTTDLEQQLLAQAMVDARVKAETLLAGTNQKIKRVVTISESGNISGPWFYKEAANTMAIDQAVPVEPGSQTIYKTITVVFEIGR